jgi:hypothetical protein
MYLPSSCELKIGRPAKLKNFDVRIGRVGSWHLVGIDHRMEEYLVMS